MTVIITCAITGAVTSRSQTPYLPVTPEEIAASALEAAEAGAAVAHIHVRDPHTGKPSMDLELYRETVDIIRKYNKSLLINLTTGSGANYIPDPENMNVGTVESQMRDATERIRHVELIKPDLCSMDFNTMHTATDKIRINYRPVIKEMITRAQNAGTKPELEIFDSGDLRIAKEFVAEGTIKGTPFWQFAMGVKYGWEANVNTLLYALNQLPCGSVWSAFGISKDEMPILAHTCLLGGHVRVGLEDNIYVRKGVLATSNAELVKMAVELLALLGHKPADFSQARKILLS